MKKIACGVFAAFGFLVSAAPFVKDGDRIAFVGDSITNYGNCPSGFIGLVMDGLKRSGVKNAVSIGAGVNGDRSNTILARLDRVLAGKPDIVVLKCGTNDVGWGKRGCTLDQYKANICAILDKCSQAGVRVVLVTPTMHTEHASSRENRLLEGYCEFLRQEARKRSLPLADWNLRMHETLRSGKIDGDRMYVLTVDKLHLNGYGNRLLAETLLETFGVSRSEIEKWIPEWENIPSMAVLLNVWHRPQFTVSIREYKKLREEARKKKTTVDALLKKILRDYINTLN